MLSPIFKYCLVLALQSDADTQSNEANKILADKLGDTAIAECLKVNGESIESFVEGLNGLGSVEAKGVSGGIGQPRPKAASGGIGQPELPKNKSLESKEIQALSPSGGIGQPELKPR